MQKVHEWQQLVKDFMTNEELEFKLILKKILQGSECRNTHSTKHGKEKSNAQGKDEKFVGQKDEMLYQKGGNLTSMSINSTYGHL